MTNRKVTLEFDVADLPMLADSLRTTACEAMMEGRPGARKRIKAYRQAIDALIPEAARVFDGLTWSEICLALADARHYQVGFEEWGYEWKKDGSGGGTYGRIYVVVGDKRFGSHDYKHFRISLAAVADLVHQMAPLDCSRRAVEDTKARHLRPRPAPAPGFDDDRERGWKP
jgi:hypothetical protein